MRPRIRTNGWLCVISGIILVVSVLSSPIRAPRFSNTPVPPNFLTQNFALVCEFSDPALASATPCRASVLAGDSDIEEEDDDESFWAFSHLVRPTFIPLDSPAKQLLGPRPHGSPPRNDAVPLRC